MYQISRAVGLMMGQDNVNDGTNIYNTDQWAEPYNVGTSSSKVRAVSFAPWKILNQSGNGSITINVYSNVSGQPGAVLGSQNVLFSDLTVNQYNTVEFTTPVNVSGQFFVGYMVSFTSPVDSFALLATEPATSFTQFHIVGPGSFNNTWNNVSDIYTLGGNAASTAFVMDVLLSTSTPPSALANILDTNACLSGNFSVNSTGSTGTIDEYSWLLTDPTISTVYNSQTGASAILTPTTATPSQQLIGLVLYGACVNSVDILSVHVYPNVSATITPTSATCGNNDGKISITANGGLPPYLYSIDNGTNTQG